MNIQQAKILFNQAGSDGGGSGGGAAGDKGAGGGQSGSGANAGNNGGAGSGASGAAGGSGSAGAPDLLFGDNKGQSGNGAGNGTGQGGQNPNPPTGENPNAVVIPANWKEALPPELRDEGFMKNVPDIPTLVKNYANAQKMIGADKVPIPTKHATEAEWREVDYKLGLPRELAEYKIEVDKDVEENMDKPFMEAFRAEAHKVGLLPKKAEALVKWFAETNKKAWADINAQRQQETNDGMQSLKREWGRAEESKVVAAKAAMKEFCTPEEQQFLKDAGLGQNPKFLRIMAKVGESLSEDKLRGAGGGGFEGGMTPAQAQEKINEVRANIKHPYWNPEHENHIAAKKEMNNLFNWANPAKSS